jgi:hypothetical protein
LGLVTPAFPGRALLHPLAAAAGLLIAWNDFWLRPRHPGFWSGKLSDAGICVLLPLLLVALAEWGAFLLSRLRGVAWRPAGLGVHVGACGITALYFAGMELSPAFARAHEAWLDAFVGGVTGLDFRSGTPDPTDLLALPLMGLAFVRMRRASRDREQP